VYTASMLHGMQRWSLWS